MKEELQRGKPRDLEELEPSTRPGEMTPEIRHHQLSQISNLQGLERTHELRDDWEGLIKQISKTPIVIYIYYE